MFFMTDKRSTIRIWYLESEKIQLFDQIMYFHLKIEKMKYTFESTNDDQNQKEVRINLHADFLKYAIHMFKNQVICRRYFFEEINKILGECDQFWNLNQTSIIIWQFLINHFIFRWHSLDCERNTWAFPQKAA